MKFVKPSLSCIGLMFAFFGMAQLSVVQNTMDEIYLEGNYPGIVFSCVGPEGKVSTFTAGYADIESGLKMTANHKLLSGSTGKTMVAAVLMQLVLEGKLTMDDSVSRWLGTESWYGRLPNSQALQVKNLAQHQSGIQRYEFNAEFLMEVKKDPDRVWKPEELISYILSDKPLFEAGKGFTYADTNYILLGMIIEKIERRPYYDVLSERILEPLNLQDIIPTDRRVIEELAQGYTDESDPLGFEGPMLLNGTSKYNLQFEWTGGGLAFRTEDYAKWLTYLFRGKAFTLKKNESLFFDMIESPEIGGRYGIGFQEMTLPVIDRVYGHSGFFPGYFTLGVYLPERDISLAIQVNSTREVALKNFFNDFIRLASVTLDALDQ